jgi:AcrR family transcriptional regulator
MTAGRPREFDYDKALDQAMRVFWEKGYEGTSLPDLTDAMGINRPSLYASFGNKEELYKKALNRYAENSAEFIREKLDAPTVREGLERLFCGTADKMACKESPAGCMSVQSALVGSDDADSARREGIVCRELVFKIFKERMERGLKDGDLPRTADAAGLARFYTTVLHGMAVQSASGVACAELKVVAHTALSALPKK